jgi:hypothetical protein
MACMDELLAGVQVQSPEEWQHPGRAARRVGYVKLTR